MADNDELASISAERDRLKKLLLAQCFEQLGHRDYEIEKLRAALAAASDRGALPGLTTRADGCPALKSYNVEGQ
jgi:hypothetical protein